MIYISFNEMLKKWKSTILISICIAFIMFFGIVLISVYESKCGIYNLFKPIMKDKKGDVVLVEEYDLRRHEPRGIDYVLRDAGNNLSGVKEVHYGKTLGTFYSKEFADRSYESVKDIKCIGLEKSFWNYKPEMIEGDWIDEIDVKEEDVIGIVISENDLGFKVGDIIELPNAYDLKNWDWYNGGELNSMMKFKICGIYSKKSLVYYSSTNMPPLRLNQSMNNLFYSLDEIHSYNEETVSGGYSFLDVLAYTTLDEVEKANSYYNKTGFVSISQNNILVDYKDDVTEKEIVQSRRFFSRIGASNFVSYEEMNDLNYREIETVMLRFVPLAIAAALLGIIAIISMSIIITKSEMKTYSVLYSVGMNWKKAVIMNNVQVLMASTLAYVLSISFYNILKAIKLDNEIIFTTGQTQNLFCLAVSLLIVIISSIPPVVMLSRTTPVDVFRKLES